MIMGIEHYFKRYFSYIVPSVLLMGETGVSSESQEVYDH